MYEVIMTEAAKDYLGGLPRNQKMKAEAILARLAALGPDLHRPHADKVRGKIRELRCGMATFEHRFFYFFDGKRIIVTHGFLKKDDRIPEREIVRAEKFHDEYFR